jgi:hypothetical protein
MAKFEDVLPALRAGKKVPTVERIKELLSYDPSTGLFVWNVTRAYKAKIGAVAGHVNQQGYVVISIDNVAHQAHRLAWYYNYGSLSADGFEIDHINGSRCDNRIENLRLVTVRENAQNRKGHRSGRLLGTTYSKRLDKWMAYIRLGDKRYYLGLFATELEAHQAYKATLEVGTQPNGAVLVPNSERTQEDGQ